MSEVATKSEKLELTIEREFAHPVEAVFKAWTHEDALRQWIGPDGVSAPEAEMDAREGGAYVFPMITPDGIMTVRGTILELVANQKLRFSWAWDQEDGAAGHQMEVNLDFHASASGTRLVLRQTNFSDADARAHHTQGWNGSFDCLAAYLDA